MERTEAGHKQWQESHSQGPQPQSSCQQEKRIDNKQLTEMVTIGTRMVQWGLVWLQFKLNPRIKNIINKISLADTLQTRKLVDD